MCCELQRLVKSFIKPLEKTAWSCPAIWPGRWDCVQLMHWLMMALWGSNIQSKVIPSKILQGMRNILRGPLLSCTPRSCRPRCIGRWPWCGSRRRSGASRLWAWRCVAGSRSRCSWRAAWARSWRRSGGPSAWCGYSGPRSAPGEQSGGKPEGTGKQKGQKESRGRQQSTDTTPEGPAYVFKWITVLLPVNTHLEPPYFQGSMVKTVQLISNLIQKNVNKVSTSVHVGHGSSLASYEVQRML